MGDNAYQGSWSRQSQKPQRSERMAEVLRRIVGQSLQRERPDLLLTLHEIKVSSDLHYADLWVGSFDQDADPDQMLEILQRELSHPATQAVSGQIRTRSTPRLRWHWVKGQTHAQTIDQALGDPRD